MTDPNIDALDDAYEAADEHAARLDGHVAGADIIAAWPAVSAKVRRDDAELRALRERVAQLEGAFLETREMLGLTEQVICEECCPTVWVTEQGRPHGKLHIDIQAVLVNHEAVRNAALGDRP